jgi:repressor LexA
MLTKSQKKTYDFIKSYINREKISPTLKEISLGINIQSRGTVSRYVQALIDLGYIAKHKAKNTSRNLELTTKDLYNLHSNLASDFILDFTNIPHLPNIPLIGTIAAGRPIEAIATDAGQEHCNIHDIFQGEGLYMLRVKGDSMIEEGIYDGDYVVCQPSNTANDGDIVVALIDNQEATLKRLYISNVDNKILLCPANSSMTPLEYDADRVQIQGILRCQLRKY